MNPPSPFSTSGRGLPRRFVLVLLLVLLPLLLPVLVSPIANWMWFRSLGYERVLLTRWVAGLLLGIGAGAIAFALVYANLRVAMRNITFTPHLARLAAHMPGDLPRALGKIARSLALAVAVITGIAAAGSWLDVLRFLNPAPFGATDPVFGRDISYYVFTLPVLTGAFRMGMALVTLSLILALVIYLLRTDVAIRHGRVAVEPAARMHLGVLLAAMFILIAAQVVFVRMPGILHSTTGPMHGASYADLHGTLIGLRLSALAALAAAVLVMVSARGPRLARAAGIGAAAYFGVSFLGVTLYPSAVHRFVVAPNELAKEAPQLESHIAATRRAWGLDSVITRDLTGEARLTGKEISANRATIDNIRLWDRDPLLQTFGQLQEIRTYYDFISVDDDRYWIDGHYRQVLLSPRELNVASLPTRTFINERLTFTHGMGLTLGPVNQVTAEGLPVLFIKDLPPVSSVSLEVTRPQIYFGEIADSWAFVNTGQKEFDHPAGDENVYASYEGDGGVRVGSYARRLLFAAYFRSMKVLLSSDITPESRALYFRNIRVRAQKVFPFLLFDRDPYIVIDGAGHLKWILDAYTTTDRYPYSQPLRGGVNYMRNSVKVVIDAYDGSVRAYVADAADPLVQSLAGVFPGLFHPLDDMPADLRAHLRYPEALFRVQAEMYATYHMDEPETFYHREDQWQRPVMQTEGAAQDPFLRHIIMRLPGESEPEFIFMAPFTPRGKDNLASWMVARNDGENYGELVVYRLPRQSLVFGPVQVVNRINQDTEVSRQISLWDQRGSTVIRGNLLVIPIEESLIYVQAIYLRAEGGRIPELKRVVVAYQNQVVMEETLEEGLSRLFGDGTAAPAATAAAPVRGTEAPAADAGVAELSKRASELYARAVDAQRAGDWARYGAELDRLGDVLRQLEAATAREP